MNKVEEHIKKIILDGRVEGNLFFLPQTQLDRKDYIQVNEVLENIGCKWNKKEKAHVCSVNPQNKLNEVIETGVTVNKKRLFQFFETPAEIADEMVRQADIKDEQTVLEPSAGHGAIAEALLRHRPFPDLGLIMVEIDPEKCEVLRAKKIANVLCEDFMGTFAEEYGKFDRVLMNPPFAKQQDLKHILHAYENCLYEEGRLVAICSNSFTFRTNKLSVKFKKLVEEKGSYKELPINSFKESGTNVNTCLVIINK